MCGIFGIVCPHGGMGNVLETLECLQKMLNRGYDSVGIATVSPQGSQIIKYSGNNALSRVSTTPVIYQPTSVIGHTRWATHGGVTDSNSHPHTDHMNTVTLVHNGVIENYSELRDLYNLRNVCKSQTDTEIIAQLIGLFAKDIPFVQAVERVQSILVGTWALVIINPLEPTKLYVCRKSSPLIVGWSDDKVVVSSEPSVLARYKASLMEIDEGKVYELDPSQRYKYTHMIKYMECDEIPLHLESGHAHWMEKEMLEQSTIIKRLIDSHTLLDYDWSRFKCCVLAGCGTSYFASQVARCMLLEYNCFDQVHCIDASDDLLPISSSHDPSEVVFIAFSQSGETRDVLELLKTIKKRGYFTVAVVNVVGSQLARTVDKVLYCQSGYEKGVASTKSFLSQITLMWMLALKMNDEYDHDNVSILPEIIGKTGMNLMKYNEIAKEFAKDNHCFILGKRETFFIASEGALKMKEIGYIHTEPFGYGSLKHGPLALIEEGTPILVIAPSKYYADCISAVHEVKARGAKVYILTDVRQVLPLEGVTIIPLPESRDHYHTTISAVIPIQWISYFIALHKGHNPDQPRSLAKTVTVK